jgi:hypothetical protein
VSSGYACDRLPTFIGYPSFGGASGQPPTSLVAASFSATFCSAFDLRRLPHLPALRSDQLPTLHRILRLPAVPFDQLPTFIGCCIVRFCLRTKPLTFVEGPILGLCFQADRRLSSVIAALRLCLPTNFRLFTGYRVLQLHLPINLRLASAINAPVLPLDQLPTFIGYCVVRLRPRTSFRLSSDAASSCSVSDEPSISFGV